MSGISSRKGTIALAVQTGKGTAATTPKVKFKLAAAPSLAPVKERQRLAMTDVSQDGGPSYTSRMGVEGDMQVYLHPDGVAFLFAALMGATADSGSTPNYTHTSTFADDMLWVTIWREVGGVIVEKYVDCKIHSLSLDAQAGGAPTATLSILGISSTFEDTDAPLTALASLSSAPYIYPEAKQQIKVGGTAKAIHRVSLSVNRNASAYQADDYIPSDVDPGAREIGLSFSTRFGSGAIGIADYRTFFYGSPSGTALDPSVGTTSFEIKFVRNVNTSVDILLPVVSYAAIPVNPDPGGDPIEVEVACNVEPNPGGQIMTVTTKDQGATAT